jgi:hypothetical protein
VISQLLFGAPAGQIESSNSDTPEPMESKEDEIIELKRQLTLKTSEASRYRGTVIRQISHVHYSDSDN